MINLLKHTTTWELFTVIWAKKLNIENYNKAIEIKKDYSNAYNNLATHYDDLGKYDWKSCAVNALKFNSDHLQAKNNLIQ